MLILPGFTQGIRKSYSAGQFVLLLIAALCLPLLCGCSSQARSMMAVEVPASTGFELEHGEALLAEAALAGDSGSFQPAEKPEIDPAQTRRLVVYNAVLNIVVERIADSVKQIKAAVTAMGGYMQQMSSSSITLKIPAKRFQDALAEAEKLGEVTRKEIKGTDVTEEMRDLNIRLGNAEQVRDRLIKLLDRAGKVEDALKIEKELARITESIELLKGKIAYLKNSVAFCTLTVHFNSPIPQQDISRMTPFRWVHELGTGLTRRAAHRPYERSSFMSKGMFALPDGYVRYYQDKRHARAMSAAGVMIGVHKEKNYKGGSVGFWGDLVRRVLVEQKVFHLKEDLKLNPRGKMECILLAGSKQIGAKQFGYLVGLAASKKYVYVFEAWGPMQEFEKDREKLVDAIKSMRLR